jgi:transposase
MVSIRTNPDFFKGRQVFVGIDVHKSNWTLTAICDGELVYDGTIAADFTRLHSILSRFGQATVHTVYEAGGFGFWLHDLLLEEGYDSVVTPPSLVPRLGGRVKTDRRDSRKLASMLAAGFLKRVYVLSPEDRADRELVRTRNQIERHRKRVQAQIKAKLLFYGVSKPDDLNDRWSREYLEWLENIPWPYENLKSSMGHLLRLFRYLDGQYKAMNREIGQLARTEKYRGRVRILTTVPGIAVYTAMSILVELQDVERFRRAEEIASFLGLTPSQYTTSHWIRFGHITRCGNVHLRKALIESSWTLIRYDKAMLHKYERLRRQTGSGKKAIVGIARTLAIRIRRLLLDNQEYALGVMA